MKRKLITGILNILLILGAIIAVATINGGKWLPAVLNFYTPVLTTDPSRPVLPATGGGSSASPGNNPATDCVNVNLPADPEWENTNAILAAYNGCGSPQPTPTPQASPGP